MSSVSLFLLISRYQDESRSPLHTDQAYFSEVSDFARTFATNRIAAIREDFRDLTSAYRDSIEKALLEIEDEIPNMHYPFENKPDQN